jgi:hypothetical protein
MGGPIERSEILVDIVPKNTAISLDQKLKLPKTGINTHNFLAHNVPVKKHQNASVIQFCFFGGQFKASWPLGDLWRSLEILKGKIQIFGSVLSV